MSRPAAKLAPHERFTYADYLTWPESERWELIDGVAYNMSPAPSFTHQELAGELFRQAANFLQDKPCRPFIAPFDVRFPKIKSDLKHPRNDTVVQPDLLVVCDHKKLDERGCTGAPDWVVEILSPHTTLKDQTVKHALYEREGVREYWVVHPLDKLLYVHQLHTGAYGKPRVQALTGTTKVKVLPGLKINWDLWKPLRVKP